MYVLKNDIDLINLLQSNELCILDFYAEWCEPCKKMAQILNMIEKEHSNLSIVKVNIDKFNDISKIHNVESLPTLAFYKNGKLSKYIITGITKDTYDKITNIINKL